MTIIFEDDFETGNFNNWTGTDTTTGETATVVTTDPHHGTYHASFTCDGSTVDERANIYKTITAQTIIYGRAYFKLKTSLPANGKRYLLIAFYAATGNSEVFRAIMNKDATGNTRWALAYRNGTAWEQIDYTTTIELNKWYCIELYGKVDGTIGEAKLYIDGTQIASATNKDTNDYGNITRIHFGERGSDGQTSHGIYVDCVKIADAYIGEEILFYIYTPPGVSAIPTSIHRTGIEYSVLRVDWHDDEDLPAGSYSVQFYVRDPNNATLGPYNGSVEKEESKEYHATYALDPADNWMLGKYDLKAVISK